MLTTSKQDGGAPEILKSDMMDEAREIVDAMPTPPTTTASRSRSSTRSSKGG